MISSYFRGKLKKDICYIEDGILYWSDGRPAKEPAVLMREDAESGFCSLLRCGEMDALQYSSCTPEDDDDLFFLVFDDEPTPQEQCYILRRIIEDSSSSFLTELSHRIDNIDGNVLQWLRDEMQHVPIEI